MALADVPPRGGINPVNLLTPLLTTSLDTGVRPWKSIKLKKSLSRCF